MGGLREVKVIVDRMEQLVMENDERDKSGDQAEDEAERHGHTKRELLKKLVDAAPQGDEHALSICLRFLDDRDGTVRMATLGALEELVPMKNTLHFNCRTDILMALGRLCLDWNVQVRQRATTLLKLIGNKTKGDAAAAVMHFMTVESNTLPLYAKLAALESILEVTVQGDEAAIDHLVDLLDDPNASVRTSVCDCLKVNWPTILPKPCSLILI